MRLISLILSLLSFSLLIGAIPMAIPDDESFELRDTIDEFLEELPIENLEKLFTSNIQKRDATGTIVKVLHVVNNSDVIWKFLDDVADSPEKIESGANLTARLIKRLGAGSIDISSLSSLTSKLNISEASSILKKSGVVTSLLDGILLDKSYRPVLAHLIERTVLANENALYYLFNIVLSKRDLEKRSSHSGSLETFVGNILATAMSSHIFTDTLKDTTKALNDTQFLTYTVKKFIADENYQNLTAKFAKDLYHTGAIKFNTSSLNISGLISEVISNPMKIGSTLQKLTTSHFDFGKYTNAVKALIKEVESDGLFATLNADLFSSASSTSTALKKELANTQSSTSASTIAQVSDSAQNSGRQISTPFTRIIQTIFVGALALIV